MMHFVLPRLSDFQIPLHFCTKSPSFSACFTAFDDFLSIDHGREAVFLTDVHYYYRRKVLVLWDNLSTHHAVDSYFTEKHPNWFEFEYFPVYPPEFNPVESCWNKMKNEYLPNFVPRTDGELVDAVDAAAMKNNEEKKVMSCFNAAGIPP